MASVLGACATYQNELQSSIDELRNGRPSAAAEKLKPKAEKDGDDQVVYLFEYGTALSLAKDYKASNKIWLQAEDATAIKDYHSISRLTGSLLLNQGMVQYKGEDYEKVFLNAMLAINFLAMGEREAAQVETRKLNEKLYKYKFEAKKDYQQNPFAFYLSAMIWESNRQWDDAYIDYKKAYETNPGIAYLKTDLVRLAKLAHREDDLAKWKKNFGAVKVEDMKGKGEVVLLFQQGWAPRKYPHPEWPRIPKLYPVATNTQGARLVIDNVGEEPAQEISSVQQVAMKTLDDEYTALVATRAAGIAAKAVAADQIRQKNELLGQLAWIGMNIADRADLRQWVTLPQSFQVARKLLPPGKYVARAVGTTMTGQPSGEQSEDFTIEIKPNQKIFIPWRSLR